MSRAELEASILSDLQGSTSSTGRLLTAKELESVARVRARNKAEHIEYTAKCILVEGEAIGTVCPECGKSDWKGKGIRTLAPNPEDIYYVECKECGWSERFGAKKKDEEERTGARKHFTYGT